MEEYDKLPKGITADTFVEIGKMFESCFKTCEGDKKEEPTEVDILRKELKQLREEVNQLKEPKLKSRKEIERKLSAIQERNKYTTNLRSNWELRARIEALNWVLGKH